MEHVSAVAVKTEIEVRIYRRPALKALAGIKQAYSQVLTL